MSKYLAVAYSHTTPKVPFIKHDPFLNLYLFKSKTPLQPVRLKSTHQLKLGEWIAGMDDSSLYAGNFSKVGDLLDSFYLHNAQMEKNSIVSCLCCEVYGLGIGAGSFIGSEYITRFMKMKDVYYGDIGVRFAKAGKEFVIREVDPFSPNNNLQSNDKVIKINGKRVTSLKQLNQTVLFAKPKSKINLEINRNGKTIKVTAIVNTRGGGGYLSDSFLEKKGIFFDEKMKISQVNKGSFGAINGLKKGDKLLRVDQTKVEDENALKEYLSKSKGKSVYLLFDRNDFQFFVKLML